MDNRYTSIDRLPISTYFSFYHYGDIYRIMSNNQFQRIVRRSIRSGVENIYSVDNYLFWTDIYIWTPEEVDLLKLELL